MEQGGGKPRFSGGGIGRCDIGSGFVPVGAGVADVGGRDACVALVAWPNCLVPPPMGDASVPSRIHSAPAPTDMMI
jgi:hypothetical protein